MAREYLFVPKNFNEYALPPEICKLWLSCLRNVNETLPCLTVGTSQPPAINKHVYTPSPSVFVNWSMRHRGDRYQQNVYILLIKAHI